MSDASSPDQYDLRSRAVMRGMIASLYFVAGLIHVVKPAPFLAITPEWVPYPGTVIFLSGLFELAMSPALISRRFRRAAGLAMAVYAICVWPANFKHAIDSFAVSNGDWAWWYHAPRLAFQPVIVWWALFSSGVIDWPVRGKDHRVG